MPLPRPEGRQKEVLALSATGHTVVLGTAGSGKTTLAILRSVYLADPDTAHSGRTLLLTFNRTLVAYLKHLKDFRASGVTVENYHTFARGYLNGRGRMRFNAICGPAERNRLVREAVAEVASRYQPSAFFQRSLDVFGREIQWISQQGISTVNEYVAATRTGRVGTRMEKALRPFMFEIFETYRRLRSEADKMYDWDDVASVVRAELAIDPNERMYRHVVIDEGQDFSPEMIRSLVAAIPRTGSLSYFGDVAQQIYGHRTSWRSAGLQIARVWRFEQNYRNSIEIARLAIVISEMPQYREVEDLVTPVAPTVSGPPPTLVQCTDVRAQIEFVVAQARNLARTFSVGLFFRDHADENLILRQLRGTVCQQLDRDLSVWVSGPGIYHGTYHSAKGLEFDAVLLPFLDNTRLPNSGRVKSVGFDEASSEDIQLLYVGVTRARRRLIMSYSGTLTDLLPTAPELYQRVRV